MGFFSKKSESRYTTMDKMHPWKRIFYVGEDKARPVMLGKGGQLLATFAFVGHDLRNSSDTDITLSVLELDRAISKIAIENGFIVHDDLTTVPSEWLRAPWFRGRSGDVVPFTNHDASPMCQMLGRKRKLRHSGLAEPVSFKTVTYQPSSDSLKMLTRILEGRPNVASAVNTREAILLEFREKVESIQGEFSKLGIVTNMCADRLYSYFLYCLTGKWLDVKAPDFSGAPIGQLMRPTREDDERGAYFAIHSGTHPMHCRIVTPYGVPPMIRPEYFEGIAEINANFRWSNRMVLVNSATLQAEYKSEWIRYRESLLDLSQSIKEKLQAGSGLEDPVKAERCALALKDVQESGLAKYGVYLSSAIVVYAETAQEAEYDAGRIARVFLDLQKPVDVETFGSKVAFQISVPGSVRHAPSQDLLPSFPAMCSVCLSLPDTGPDESGIISDIQRPPTAQFTIKKALPARVDFGKGQNRHCLITAPVRKGKSTLLQVQNLLDLLAMENPFIYQIDVYVRQSASWAAALAMGGTVISFEEGTAAIQPLAHLHDIFRFDQSVQRILMMVAAHGKDATAPELRERIVEAMELAREIPSEERTLGVLQMLVQDDDVKQCMDPFTRGAYARHVGGNRNAIGEPPFVVVDVSGLNNRDPLAGVVVAMLIDEITHTVSKHTGPVQCRIDELVEVLPLVGDSLEWAYRRWPKQGAGITVVVHDPADLVKAGRVGDVIITNTGAWICLGDSGAKTNRFYKDLLRLEDYHLSLLSELGKGEFMVKIDNRVRVLDSDLSKMELFVLGQTGKRGEQLVGRILASGHRGKHFGVQLLKEGGFYDEAKELEEVVGSIGNHLAVAAE